MHGRSIALLVPESHGELFAVVARIKTGRGTVDVRCPPGGGTTVTVQFPVN